jgi:hypothetical protein
VGRHETISLGFIEYHNSRKLFIEAYGQPEGDFNFSASGLSGFLQLSDA